MVNSTGTHTATITKRITGAAATVGVSLALALGLATPAHAATVAESPVKNTSVAAAEAVPGLMPATKSVANAAAGADATARAAAAQQAGGLTAAAQQAAVQQAAQQAAAVKAAAAQAAAAQAAKQAAALPTSAQLMPHGTPGGFQEPFHPSTTQLANAKAIVKAGQDMHLPPRAWVIAVATSMQESKLTNLGNLGGANDHDSLGLFQQRPSSGWGSPAQCTDPDHAAKAFYQGLENVSGYQNLPLTVAAQKVQVSAYPSAYAKWETAAAAVVAQTFQG